MQFAVKVLEEKLVHFLQMTGYFSSVPNANHIGHFCGPLGTLMKHNILQEWWTPLVVRGDDIIFPVSSPIVREHSDALASNSFRDDSASSLSRNMPDHFENLKPLVNNRLPFGLAQVGTTITQHAEQTNLVIQFFCTPSTATRWFQHWQRKRYLWWRRFSGVPSAFRFSEIQTTDRVQHLDIYHESSWGKCCVETITSSGSERLQVKDETSSVSLHVIECNTSLDVGMIAYLLDGYREQLRHNSLRTVLRLHPKLAPYKAKVMASATQMELRELATYVTQILKRDNHSVFPVTNDETPLENQFIRSDELGIPCCIVVDETTLKSGLARIRNRDTTLLEDVRVSELQKRIQHYLNDIS